jgi:WD40 repeat protein
MKKTLLLIIFMFVLPYGALSADIDPSFRFSTIETEHFKIHFHQGIEETAERAADLAEEAHCYLSEALGWSPKGKTHVVLIDNSDFAGGMAYVMPRNAIYLQTVPPSGDMTIGQYDDWLKAILIHEYAHIISLDPARGYSELTRSIFGKPPSVYDPLSAFVYLIAAPPNTFLPRWWTEGISVWAESEFTTSGRGRNTYYEMIFRTAVSEGILPAVDTINGDVPDWPSGSAPYIWGLALDRYIQAEHGEEALRELNLEHSGTMPYFISGPSRRVTGSNYAELYIQMIIDMVEEQNEKIGVLRQLPLTPFEKLPIEGERLTNPRLSRDGKMMAVSKRDPHGHEGVLILEGDEVRSFVRRRPSDRSVTWGPDDRGIYFTQVELRGGYNLYQDLYYYDIEKGKTRRLTKDTRIKDPDLSPDGRVMALVRVESERQGLALIDIDKEETSLRILKDFEHMRVSGPRWSPDGSRIVFTTKDNEGNTSIWLYDTAEGGHEEIIKDDFDNKQPTWSPDGEHVIFISDRTGVFNLYAYSIPEKRIYQITNLIGGAFEPDVSPDGKGIVFSSYSSRGFSIATIDYAPDTWRDETGPVIEIDWPSEGDNAVGAGCSPASINGDSDETPTQGKEEPVNPSGMDSPASYSAMGSILPGFWLPTLGYDHKEPVLGAFTAGGDVLGFHSYYLQAGVSSRTGRVYYNSNYVYDRYYPRLSLSGYKRPSYTCFKLNGADDRCFDDLHEEQIGIVASVSLPIRRLESGFRMQIGYHYKKHETLDGPDWAFEGERSSLFTSLIFDNTRRYPYSISYEEGRRVSFTFRDYSESRLSDLDSREYLASYEEYRGFRDHKVILLRLKGGLSEGERIPQGAFDMGGYPEPVNDFPLRGYPAGVESGKGVLTGTFEYRRPLVYLLRGLDTKPLFLDRLHIAAFADSGIVWDSNPDIRWKDVRTGVGLELKSDVVVGYMAKITPTLGIARGLSEGGEYWIYITVYLGV